MAHTHTHTHTHTLIHSGTQLSRESIECRQTSVITADTVALSARCLLSLSQLWTERKERNKETEGERERQREREREMRERERERQNPLVVCFLLSQCLCQLSCQLAVKHQT